MGVHAKGKIRFLDLPAILEVLKHTTNHFENNPHSPANFENLPEDYVLHLSKAIVAFEIEVESLENVFKLSQNRDEKSYDNIMEKLRQQDHNGQVIAEEMKLRKKELFS